MAYLTFGDYLARFGEAETVRLTDEAKTGDVDQAKVEAEIAQAEALVESYLGGRYALPLNPVPETVRGFVGDLAREGLHRVRPVEAVTAAADRARKFLVDVSKGVAVLPVQTAEPSTPPPSLAIMSGDARPSVFGGCALDEYTAPFAPPGCV